MVRGFHGPSLLLLVVGLIASGVSGLATRESSLAFSGSPVTKVVELIEELKAKVGQDEINEQKIYNKYACWCETTSKRKADAIKTAKEDIKRLGSSVLEAKAKVASTANSIATLASDIRKNEEAQQRAVAIREKENTDYMQEKAEMEQAIGALEKGLGALRPGGARVGASLLKISSATSGSSRMETKAELKAMATGVRDAMNALPAGFVMEDEKLALVKQFVKHPAAYIQQGAAYDPQSATVGGILKSMYDTFASNLESEQQRESGAQKNFEDLMSTKAKELVTMKGLVATNEAAQAEAEQQYADFMIEMQGTEEQLTRDSSFFEDLKASCTTKADEWSERSRLRQQELEGINKALEVLTGDDARALFNKAIKPGVGFLQVTQDEEGGLDQDPKAKAVYQTLTDRAAKLGSMRLAVIANGIRTRTGHDFSKVVKEVDKMIQRLKDEEQEDIDQRDWCKETTFKKENEASRYGYEIEKIEAKLTKLNEKVSDLESAIAETDAEIQQTKDELEEMASTRKAENGAFLEAKADDEAAAELLGTAIGHLSKFYDENAASAALLAKKTDVRKKTKQPTFEVSEDQAPEASFTSADKSKGEAGGILSIMTMLKEDLELEVKNGVKEEEEAEAQYAEQKKAAEKLIETLEEKKTDLKSALAETNSKVDSREADQQDTQELMDGVNQELSTMKPNCDFILKYFKDRRDRRANEMSGLMEAKALMSGAGGVPGTSGFLQKA